MATSVEYFCPVTKEPLHLATEEERKDVSQWLAGNAGKIPENSPFVAGDPSEVLLNASGNRAYLIDRGIPRLLPGDGLDGDFSGPSQ